MSDLEKIRRLLSEATEGPWEVEVGGPEFGEDEYCDGITSNSGQIVETDSGVYPPSLPDARLIAAMRNALPALLDRVEELEGALRKVQGSRYSTAMSSFVITAEAMRAVDAALQTTDERQGDE